MNTAFRFVALMLALACLPLASAFAAEERKRTWQVEDDALQGPTDIPGYTVDDLRALATAVEKTGVKMGEIPAIIKPVFLSISDASLSMDDDETVFVVHHGTNLVRIYPQRILVWHETVNDTVESIPASSGWPATPTTPAADEQKEERYVISYSPLSGSVVGFRGMAGSYPALFGSSGELLNGNSVLFDFISHSMWSQLLAGSFEGPFRGKRLERIQVTWARWGGVKERYGGLDTKFSGKAEVLSRATGHRRTYGRDPYGSYDNPNSYYNNATLPSSLQFTDERLPPKKRILGLEFEKENGAVLVDEVKRLGVHNFDLSGQALVAIYDRELDAVRVFDRSVEDRATPLVFALAEGNIVDQASSTEWLPTGMGKAGLYRERQLREVLSIDSMWFAWAAFHRGTRIIPQPQPAQGN